MSRKEPRYHTTLMDMLNTRLASRRSMLRGTAIAGAGLISSGYLVQASAQDGTPEVEVVQGEELEETPEATPTGDSPFESVVDVVNYALTLEHLETAFYRDGLASLDSAAIEALGFQSSVYDNLLEIAAHEAAHVEILTAVVSDLGGEPEGEATYDFGYADAAGFLEVALALEDTGVSAYGGAAQYLIEEDDLLTAALTIHGVEARHASYLALLNETNPFPDAANPPLTPAEVLDIATPFITG